MPMSGDPEDYSTCILRDDAQPLLNHFLTALRGEYPHQGGINIRIQRNPGQGLFQDFASEGANAKFQNSRGGNTKPRRGNPILKGQKSQFLGGQTDPKGGQKHPPPPPEINPAGHLSSFQWPCESIHVVL